MKRIAELLILVVLFITLSTDLFAENFTIDCALIDNNNVRVLFSIPERLKVQRIDLYRSSSNLNEIPIDMYAYPITKFLISGDDIKNSFIDRFVAHNTTYYYVAKIRIEDGLPISSNVAYITIPDVVLGHLANPGFLIDKVHYYLEVRDNEQPRKRYPIALGQNPMKRKLHQDNSSTPEGIYKIINLQPKATFYKAYDINYPNRTDRVRYNRAKAENRIVARGDRIPGIGGEIQIHGMGIWNNWTFGCIAMRNKNIDELFSHKEIGVGTPVIIIGREITRENIVSMKNR